MEIARGRDLLTLEQIVVMKNYCTICHL